MPTIERDTITLGGGCFWCVEAVFDQLRGVIGVTSGYAGGHVPHPTYQDVCNEETGHAEVVQVEYDPNVISLREILEVFFTTHDPTTPNQQGADVGSQYRSIVLYQSNEQREIAEKVIRDIEKNGIWGAPAVTELVPLEAFYPAEEAHKEYYRRNPNQGYCRAIIAPKVAKLRKQHLDKLKSPATQERTNQGAVP